MRDNDIDWDASVSEMLALGVPTRAFVSLSMAAGLLGTPVPEHALGQLFPGSARWHMLSTLLTSDGVIHTGAPKLQGAKTVALDFLLEERSLVSWMRSIFLPSESWLREHFEHENGGQQSVWSLQFARWRQLVQRWRPE